MYLNYAMELQFYKYQGTGNDFIIIDNRALLFPKNDTKLIARFCDRRFGIGADGLLLLENDDSSDFKMIYYNSDGNLGSMCGNGGRCLVAFANRLGIIEKETAFVATDGVHHATIENDKVSLKMKDVSNIIPKKKSFFLNTGSPHHVQLVNELDSYKVVKEGKRLRYGVYGEKGSNINFVEQATPDTFAVRTYERGVENETLSCGTGVTAVALAMYHGGKTASENINIRTKGGELRIRFKSQPEGFTDIYLQGPAELVYKGTITW